MPKIFSLFINSFSELKLDYHPAIVQRQGFSYFNGGDLEEIRKECAVILSIIAFRTKQAGTVVSSR